MLGYHVLKQKTFKQSIEEPHKISNINAFQIFARNPRQLKNVEIKEREAGDCKKYVLENSNHSLRNPKLII